jgi:hypothetical protein
MRWQASERLMPMTLPGHDGESWKTVRMDAVVFDLFGTLTDPASMLSRQAMMEETAEELGISPGEFWTCWSRSFPQRITGG